MTKKQKRFRFTDTEMEIAKSTDLSDVLSFIRLFLKR